MTVNTDTKKTKTAKNAEALTVVGVRMTTKEIQYLDNKASVSGRTRSQEARNAILCGLAMVKTGKIVVEIDASVVKDYLTARQVINIDESIQDLIRKEIRLINDAKRLSERRQKIKEYQIEEVK